MIGLKEEAASLERLPIDGSKPRRSKGFASGRMFNCALSLDGKRLAEAVRLENDQNSGFIASPV